MLPSSPPAKDLQVNSLPIFFHDWEIRKMLLQIFLGFPQVSTMSIFFISDVCHH